MQKMIENWPQLKTEFDQAYFKNLKHFLTESYKTKTIYPKAEHIFNAFKLTAFEDVSIVILGQDPYHGPHQAHGLSFSTQNRQLPPSLKNMFKELSDDLGIFRTDGDLSDWAQQGVLLLNSVLTVEAGKAHSHKNKGWETFTDRVITCLNQKSHPIVYLLWGKAAQEKINMIDTSKHFVIQSVHPSPLSAYRGFFGSKPFSKANNILSQLGLKQIKW